MGHRLLPRAQDRLAPGRSVAQLAALQEVDELLAREGIDYWLFGGWAVDFYAGVLTRPHDDVDLAVSFGDHDRIAALLRRHAWVHAPDPDEHGGTGYERDGIRLELTFLDQVPWPPGSLGDEGRELDGVGARLIGLDALKRGKSRPREDPDEAAKDRADASVLAAL